MARNQCDTGPQGRSFRAWASSLTGGAAAAHLALCLVVLGAGKAGWIQLSQEGFLLFVNINMLAAAAAATGAAAVRLKSLDELHQMTLVQARRGIGFVRGYANLLRGGDPAATPTSGGTYTAHGRSRPEPISRPTLVRSL